MVSEMTKLTPDEFAKFAKFVHDMAGIYISEDKSTLLSNRLRRRIRALSLESFGEYYRKFSEPAFAEDELPHFLSAVTTNETYFYRNERLWELLENRLIPEFLERHAKTDRTIKVWSAAASSGEEAYTAAIVLRESLPEFAKWNVRIVASDISKKVLDAARQGIYNDYAVAKMKPELRQKWFRAKDDRFELKDEIRKMVDFKFHNLRDPFPQGGFDFVLLRNVLMYFDNPMKIRTMEMTAAAVAPGGYLYIGDVDPIRSSAELLRAMPLTPDVPGLYRKLPKEALSTAGRKS